jgi:hypothetical protein
VNLFSNKNVERKKKRVGNVIRVNKQETLKLLVNGGNLVPIVYYAIQDSKFAFDRHLPTLVISLFPSLIYITNSLDLI